MNEIGERLKVVRPLADKAELRRRRSERERDSKREIFKKGIIKGSSVRVRKTSEFNTTEVVDGFFDGYYRHKKSVRGIVVQTADGEERIRFRGIIDIVKMD